MALFDKSRVDSFAYAKLGLGKAYLESEEVEEAARIIGDAASLAGQNRSVRLVKDVQAARAQMQPWQDTQAVKVLDEQLGEYGLRTEVGG